MKTFGVITFGKYKGHTIPWVAFHDPEYLFKISETATEFKSLKDDLNFVCYTSKRIKVPGNRRIRYITNAEGQFESIEVEHPFFDDGDVYQDMIDLSYPISLGRNSRAVCKLLVRQLKSLLFGSPRKRMTEESCQQFFRNPDNFRINLEPESRSSLPVVEVVTNSSMVVPGKDSVYETKAPVRKKKVNTENVEGLEILIPVPISIIERIDHLFQNKTERRRAKEVIYHIIQYHQLWNIPIVKFRSYPEAIKKKLLTNRHYHIWGKIVVGGILENYVNDDGITFHWKAGVSKRYRINPKMLAPPYAEIHVPYEKDYHIVEEGHLIQFTANSLRSIIVNKPDDEALKKIHHEIYVKHKVRTELQYVSESKLTALNVVVAPDSPVLHLCTTIDLRRFDLTNRIMGMDNKLKMLEYKAIFASRCNLNARLDHNLTNLDKLLFPLLRLEGERVAEIDLSNSQPLLFSRLVKNILLVPEPSRLPLFDGFLYSFIHFSSSPEDTSIILSSHFDQAQIHALKIEIIKMESWCSAGAFYDEMAIYSDQGTMTRDIAKKGFISVMFGKYNHTGGFKGVFSGVFPLIVQLLDGFKRAMHNYFHDNVVREYTLPDSMRKYLHSKSQGAKNPYRAGNDYLAIRLQEVEASIFIDRILERIAASGIVAFSRHDSICCKETDLEQILKIVRYEMDRVFGEQGYNLKWSVWE